MRAAARQTHPEKHHRTRDVPATTSVGQCTPRPKRLKPIATAKSAQMIQPIHREALVAPNSPR